MAGHNAGTKSTAKKKATKLRGKGLNVSIYKKKKGWGVSATRSKKKKKK